MFKGQKVVVVMPAYNAEKTLMKLSALSTINSLCLVSLE